MLHAFAQVARSNPRPRLLLVGGGPRCAEAERLVAELDLQQRVILTGFVTESDLVRAASVCLVAHRAEHVVQIGVSPAKLAEYFAPDGPSSPSGFPASAR